MLFNSNLDKALKGSRHLQGRVVMMMLHWIVYRYQRQRQIEKLSTDEGASTFDQIAVYCSSYSMEKEGKFTHGINTDNFTLDAISKIQSSFHVIDRCTVDTRSLQHNPIPH